MTFQGNQLILVEERVRGALSEESARKKDEGIEDRSTIYDLFR